MHDIIFKLILQLVILSNVLREINYGKMVHSVPIYRLLRILDGVVDTLYDNLISVALLFIVQF